MFFLDSNEGNKETNMTTKISRCCVKFVVLWRLKLKKVLCSSFYNVIVVGITSRFYKRVTTFFFFFYSTQIVKIVKQSFFKIGCIEAHV